MLRIRRRYGMLEDNRRNTVHDHRNDSYEEAVTKHLACRPSAQEHTSSSVTKMASVMKAREHRVTGKRSVRNKKKLCNRNMHNSDDNEVSVGTGKVKTYNSDDNSVVQPSENLYHAAKSGAVKHTGRKKRKRKFDSVDQLEGDVSCKSGTDSVGEETTESPAKHSLCDLQHLEDCIVDDYVSTCVIISIWSLKYCFRKDYIIGAASPLYLSYSLFQSLLIYIPIATSRKSE